MDNEKKQITYTDQKEKKKALCYRPSIELSERFQMQKTTAAVLFHYVKF